MKPKSCKHFNGFRGSDESMCEAGICYRKLVPSNEGLVFRLPCGGNEIDPRFPRVECASYEQVTEGDIKRERAAVDAAMERMVKTLPWVAVKKREMVRGKGDYHGQDTCPICSGLIVFSISDYNGHMHARCRTENCVNFME